MIPRIPDVSTEKMRPKDVGGIRIMEDSYSSPIPSATRSKDDSFIDDNASSLPVRAPQSVPKMISKGVINGSAILLPKPAYPPAAKAVGATGMVNVQVTLDEAGNVISAVATSGHPLLKSVAAKAAREAKFRPTKLSGVLVKVSGIIIYNFQ